MNAHKTRGLDPPPFCARMCSARKKLGWKKQGKRGRHHPLRQRRNEKRRPEKRVASGEHPGFVRCLSGFAFEVRSGCACSLAVGFAAVFYGEDQDGISEIVEADAVVADAETELWRLDVLEALDIAFAGGEITSHDMQDTERGGLVDSAEVGFGRVGPGDLPPHRYWPLL